ncbi:MAG: hypothetical protein QOH03_4247, partial [Kribbellaceae bacterium]|nr:hypothetical protein [Kribbellaceae bacterium]
ARAAAISGAIRNQYDHGRVSGEVDHSKRRRLTAMSARILRLGALLAVLAFLAPSPAAATPPQLLDQIAAGWKTDRIYVYDALRPAMPASELARIKAATRTVPFPVYVALLPRTPDSQESLDLPTLLQARVGQPGLYLVWTVSNDYWSGTETLIRPGGLRGRDLTGVQLDDKQDNKIVTDRPAPRIVRTIQQAATTYDGRALPAAPADDLEKERTYDDGLSATDKADRAAFIGMGVGGVLGFLLVIVLTLRHRDKKSAPRKRGTESGLTRPDNVWSVRGKADRWIVKAGKTLKRLETQIRTARGDIPSELLDRRDDASARLAAARTLRADESDDLTAPAGAFVLARQAYEAASGGGVRPPCFFNPLHEPGTVQAAWSDETEVPACGSCAQVLERGETPQGFLVWKKSGLLRLDHKAVPYWTLNPKEQPLVATGFGALEDDLTERVGRQHGGDR